MTGSMNNVTTTAAQTGAAASKNLLQKNPVLGVFMLGAVAWTAKQLSDTYTANEPREAQGVSAERAKKDYTLMMYDAGAMSGKGPFWDGLRHFGKWMDLYGPYGLKEDLQEFRDKVHSVWKEVIIPNLPYIGISIASIYGFFGIHNVHKPIKAGWKIFAKQLEGATYGTTLLNGLKRAGKFSAKQSGNLAKHMFNNPAVTAGTALLAAFGYKTWYEVKTGRAQDEYFRSEIFNNSGTVEDGL